MEPMDPLPTPREVDEHCARLLGEITKQLQRGFATGIGLERDFPRTLEAYKLLGDVLDKEAAVEVSMSIRDRLAMDSDQNLASQNTTTTTTAPSGKHVCFFVDGSSNSYDALRWGVSHIIHPEDHIHLVNVMPYQEYEADSTRILQEAMDYSHGVGGVKARHLHVKAIEAKSSSVTGGVGESIKHYVEESKVDVVVLGSRGLGSIKRSLLGALGMGSISDYCVQNLTCPVLVVKPGGNELQSALETGAGASA